MEDLRDYIDNLNRIYNVDNNSLIGFYMKCEPTIINDNKWFEIGGDGEAWNLIQNNKEKGCINIHIVGDYERTAGIHIRSRVFGRDGIVLNFGATGTIANTTIAHEVGHYLELDHTHQYSNRGQCRKEAIDRNRTWPFLSFCFFGGGGPTSQRICEATGDCLSDTPADPDLTNNQFNVIGTCLFNELGTYTNARDPWNDSYAAPPAGAAPPDTRNVMSYNRDRDCRTVFSRLQIGVMLYSIERGKSKNNKNGWINSKAIYDGYEMDNVSLNARPIILGEIQERNFHQQYNEDIFGNAVWSQCDVDWVRFVAPCNTTLPITTTAIPAYLNATANTRLTLFAANATTQLAQNDNISTTNLFSSITWNFVAGQTYFIRVENMAPNVTGYYQLSISPNSTINGSDNLCTAPNTYNIPNLPAGATVAWSTTPANLTTPSTGNGVTFTTSSVGPLNGNITLTAAISTPACGLLQAAIKTLGVGSISTAFTVTYQVGSNFPVAASPTLYYVPPSQVITFTINGINSPMGATGIIEKVYGNTSIFGSGNSVTFSLGNYSANNPQNGLITLLVKVTAPCSNTTVQAYTFTTRGQCASCGSLFRVSPNPAIDGIKIEELDAITGLQKTTSTITAIELTDKMGNIIYSKTFNSKLATSSISIPVAQFKNDVYTIRIFNGTEWEVQQIIIQR